jgi:type I restriction enzyme M protein
VKTNVLFFTKRSDAAKDATQAVWIYDLRANMPQFGKRTLLTHEHFREFIEAYGDDPNGGGTRAGQGETGRFRCFTRAEIATRDDSLDIAWLKDESATDAADLPEPEVLAQEAMQELEGVFADLKELMEALGVEEVE